MDILKTYLRVMIFLLLLTCGCQSSLKETEYQKIRLSNRVEKQIQRRSSSQLISYCVSEVPSKNAFPWQPLGHDLFPLITKEFFRCKGDRESPSYLKNEERLFDCNGSERHSLPLKEGKEFVYPILIQLLNHLQQSLNAQVVVTCGHRCPQHNRYSDTSEYNQTSKHMLAAEVDFYVQGYEQTPEIVIEKIIEFYQQPKYQGMDQYQFFSRYTKKDVNVSTPPWFNQEIFLKIYKAHEGRDFDNKHKFPYVSIQVRQDPISGEKVTYTWQQAFYNYLRN